MNVNPAPRSFPPGENLQSGWIQYRILLNEKDNVKCPSDRRMVLFSFSFCLGNRNYSVAPNGVFFRESMFYEKRDASKAALVALVERMKERGMVLLDVQYTTPHLTRFGAKEIPRDKYLRMLRKALDVDANFFP